MVGWITGEWFHFPYEGMARKAAKVCSNKGVPARGISGKEGIGRGEVVGGGVEAPDGPGASDLGGSGGGPTYVVKRHHHRDAPGQ